MIEIAKKVIEEKEKQIKLYPRDVNRASDAGHPCIRYLVFSRIAWDKRRPHDVGLQFIFDRGIAAETTMDEELKIAGFKVVEAERTYEDKGLQLRGTIDRKIEVDGVRVPLEYKTVSPREINNIAIAEDMMNSKRVYIQQWPAQLLLYMLLSGSPDGVWYFKNSLTWYPKDIWVKLEDHMEYVFKLVDKLRVVNDYVGRKEAPDMWPEDYSVCDNCAFLLHCQPEVHFGKEAEIYERPDIEEKLEERESLKDYKDRYEDVDKEVKDYFKGVEKALCGRFLIEGKEVVREMKPQPARTDRFWKLTIKATHD
jgi:hypothetical protein